MILFVLILLQTQNVYSGCGFELHDSEEESVPNKAILLQRKQTELSQRSWILHGLTAGAGFVAGYGAFMITSDFVISASVTTATAFALSYVSRWWGADRGVQLPDKDSVMQREYARYLSHSCR